MEVDRKKKWAIGLLSGSRKREGSGVEERRGYQGDIPTQSHEAGPQAGTWAKNKHSMTSRYLKGGDPLISLHHCPLCFWGNWGSGLKQVAQDHMGSDSQAFRVSLIGPTYQLFYGLVLWLGEGNGNPLQYFCLATVHGVTESQTQLSI